MYILHTFFMHGNIVLDQIALIHPGAVLGHCPVEKQMVVTQSANQMVCCGSHAS